ncbi:MAG: hypothetical protein ACYTAF_16745 [Planctomycetota bacterium]
MDHTKYRVLCARHGRELLPQDNRSVMQQAGRGCRYYSTTRGICDCDTSMGSATGEEEYEEDRIEKDLEKLRGKGWSKAKVDRWLQDKEKAARNRERSRRACGEAAGEWVAFLTEFLEASGAPFVGILLHWYNGQLSERITLKGIREVPLGRLTDDFVAHMEEDVVYRFVNRPGGGR